MVEGSQRGRWEEVQLVVSDRQLLQFTLKRSCAITFQISRLSINLTFKSLEGSAVNLCNLVVIEFKRRDPWQTLKLARAQHRQMVVVQSQEIKRFQT